MTDTRSRRRSLSLVLTLGASWLLGGCDFLLGSDREPPDQAQIEVEAEATAPLLVVLSKDFQLTFDAQENRPEALILLADTTIVEPVDFPYTTTLDLAPENRILARVVNPSVDTALVQLVVRMDGSVTYDRTVQIADSQYVEYNYHFVAQ